MPSVAPDAERAGDARARVPPSGAHIQLAKPSLLVQKLRTTGEIRHYSQAFEMRLTSGLAKTASVIDAIIQQAKSILPVLILTIPNYQSGSRSRNPITTTVQP